MGIPVIDVFAGPGGLNEGFSSIRDVSGARSFTTVGSFEMDSLACETLKLRATYRLLRDANGGRTPDSYLQLLRGAVTLTEFYAAPDVEQFAKEAAEEVHRVELGVSTRSRSDQIIRERLGDAVGTGEWVLIGGPPCQAYSLAGRSRRVGDPTFAGDHKHVLYREYLHILQEFAPAVFVMENVKGMLSSEHDGGKIFPRIKADLERPRDGLEYEIRSLVTEEPADALTPGDFIIRAEEYGIPQRRHRVILLGVRKSHAHIATEALTPQPKVTVRSAIQNLPPIRSRMSPLRQDSDRAWNEARLTAVRLAGSAVSMRVPPHGASWMSDVAAPVPGELGEWLTDDALDGVSLHEARRHMRGDLERYAYLSAEALKGRFPKVMDLPSQLIPNHKNARRTDAPFADRFRVQRWDQPSTTVVSHIAKDGHYYIHPDPTQMRSLTVREAARLQSFPDNYWFVGNRTQQYHQVGNAVPPLLARQIGVVVSRLFDTRGP